MKTISLKTKYVRNGWRGYVQPINAVCGANDTGTYSNSPCNSNVRIKELNQVKSILRKNKIRFKQMYCETSNAFCIHVYICVDPENKEKAKNLIEPLIDETRLLYITD